MVAIAFFSFSSAGSAVITASSKYATLINVLNGEECLGHLPGSFPPRFATTAASINCLLVWRSQQDQVGKHLCNPRRDFSEVGLFVLKVDV